jgi:hypothetical protein
MSTQKLDKLKKQWNAKFPTWFRGKVPLTRIAWEVILFHKLRRFRDGVSFFELIVNLDLYDPLEYAKFIPCPYFRIHLVFLNYTIIEMDIYRKIKA